MTEETNNHHKGRVIKKKINEANNFYYMTVALVMLLVSTSLVAVLPNKFGLLEYILEGFTALTFLVCLVSLRFDKNWYRFMMALAGCWLVATIIRNWLGIQEMDLIMLGLMFSFFFGTFKSVARQILFTGSVDSNKVVGSVSLFLLLGLMWTIIYLLVMEFSPEAFTGMTAAPWVENFSRMAYFSFVTLTTLGYGDISPLSPIAQVVVYLEAIAGVFYMAIVVASLVSSSQSNQDK
ncbi:MAG: potassium channel family protein [Photobacterium frigidiphilum]|uniref:potassium channel family protein n=1 Tax=Photobacterium frigidiphilum TaxID=264736 RepID=UPI0030037346